MEHALKPRTKQSEDTIADHLKVSRTSVRGALVRPNAEGFVDLSADKSACASDHGPLSIRLAGEFHILLAELTGPPAQTRFVREVVSRCLLNLARFARLRRMD